MKKTGFLFDERFLSHETGPFHPEVPGRLRAVYNGIADAGLLSHLRLIRAQKADPKWIETVHDPEYIFRFRNACGCGQTMFDSPDNQMCAETYETALLAVGGIIETTRLVMSGEIDNAFCAVRPPGHHAEKSYAMGFCYFNNVAIAARYVQLEWQVRRVGIIDFDVHHGNGTQHIFEADPSVFYFSIHEHPSFAFPGTGREFEKGKGKGDGFTGNYPVLPGMGDLEYQKIMDKYCIPSLEGFKPQVILVSTGFDAHIDDNMSDMKLTTEGFSWIMRRIVDLAERCARGKLISVLEGGYALERLPELARNHVQILLNM